MLSAGGTSAVASSTNSQMRPNTSNSTATCRPGEGVRRSVGSGRASSRSEGMGGAGVSTGLSGPAGFAGPRVVDKKRPGAALLGQLGALKYGGGAGGGLYDGARRLRT